MRRLARPPAPAGCSAPRLVAIAAALGAVATAAPADAAKPRVSVIGDSVAASLLEVGEARRHLGRGLDLRLDLKVCRRLATASCRYQGVVPPSALDVVRSRGRSLGRVVVIKVGYNEGPEGYRRGLDAVMHRLRANGVRSVVWVTLTETRPLYAATNRIIRATSRRRRTMCVADWAAFSKGKPYFGRDGLHLSPRGATALARLVRPYVIRATRTRSCAVPARSGRAP